MRASSFVWNSRLALPTFSRGSDVEVQPIKGLIHLDRAAAEQAGHREQVTGVQGEASTLGGTGKGPA